jgi:hypothetical protein
MFGCNPENYTCALAGGMLFSLGPARRSPAMEAASASVTAGVPAHRFRNPFVLLTCAGVPVHNRKKDQLSELAAAQALSPLSPPFPDAGGVRT